jgi:deleted in liver cancer protein
MDVRNIAICLAPTLLNMSSIKELTSSSGATSSFHSGANTSPTSPPSLLSKDPTQLMNRQCNASLDCLSLMIENPKKIFQIPNEAFSKCPFTKGDYSIPLTLNELLGSYSMSTLNIYLNDRIDEMIKEFKEKSRNWNRLRNDSPVEIYYKNIEDDDYLLRLWKLSVEIDASPIEVLNKILKCRAEWDDDMLESRIVETLNSQTDIFQYVMHLMAPQLSRDFCELRSWREATYLHSKYSYLVFSTSVEHDKASVLGDIRAVTLRNFYLIESSSSNENKCKVHQLYRADYR